MTTTTTPNYLNPSSTYEARFDGSGINTIFSLSNLKEYLRGNLAAGIEVLDVARPIASTIFVITLKSASPYTTPLWVMSNTKNAIEQFGSILGVLPFSISPLGITEKTWTAGLADTIGSVAKDLKWPLLGLAALAVIFMVKR